MFHEKISPYGVLIAVGLLSAGFLACYLAKKKKLSVDDVIIIFAYTVALGMVGAKLLYLAVHAGEIAWSRMFDWEYLSAVLSGGFVFYGGLIGGIAALVIVKAAHKIDAMQYIKVIIPAVPLAHAFGRVGCYFAGCCYGIPYDGVFSVVYKNNAIAPGEIGLFPVQLLEALINFVLAGVLSRIVIKKEISSAPVYLYAGIYGVCRFFLEFLRYDTAERGVFAWLSTSQWISVALCAASCVLFLREKRKR